MTEVPDPDLSKLDLTDNKKIIAVEPKAPKLSRESVLEDDGDWENEEADEEVEQRKSFLRTTVDYVKAAYAQKVLGKKNEADLKEAKKDEVEDKDKDEDVKALSVLEDGGDVEKDEKGEEKRKSVLRKSVDFVKAAYIEKVLRRKNDGEEVVGHPAEETGRNTIPERQQFISKDSLWMAIVGVLIIIIMILSFAYATVDKSVAEEGFSANVDEEELDFPPIYRDEFLLDIDGETLFGTAESYSSSQFVFRTDPDEEADAINFLLPCQESPVTCFLIGFAEGNFEALTDGCLETKCQQLDSVVLTSADGGVPLNTVGVSVAVNESGVEGFGFQFNDADQQQNNQFAIFGQVATNDVIFQEINGTSTLKGIFGNVIDGVLANVGFILAPTN